MDERDDLTDDGDVTVYRARARDLLNEISQLAKEALADQGVDIDLFFIVPNSGEAVLIYGTPADPDDASWERAGEIVVAILGGLIGLRGTRRREVQCATTDDLRQPAGADATKAMQHAGGEV